MNLIDLFKYLEAERRWKGDFSILHFDAIEFSSRLGTQSAKSAHNRDKNRYIDVLPFDETRVILSGNQDYINASHVTPPFVNQRYICSQGPLKNTSKDFWKMIWDEESYIIAMLNKVIENNRIKCYPYWPTGETDEDGVVDDVYECPQFKVTLLSKQDYDFYAISMLNVLNKSAKEERVIHHLHYKAWPDFGVPESPTKFLQYLKTLRKYYKPNHGPPVVHCSAGIGRTGTLLLVDTILKIIEEKKTLNIDVYSILVYTRQQRLGLVQTPDQLRFCFLAIIEGLRDFDIKEFTNERIVAELPMGPESSEGSVEYMFSDEESDEDDAAEVINDDSAPNDELDIDDGLGESDVSSDEDNVVSPSSIEIIPSEELNDDLSAHNSESSHEEFNQIKSIFPISGCKENPDVRDEEEDNTGQESEKLAVTHDTELRKRNLSDNDSERKKRKQKTAEIVSSMKERLKTHDKKIDQKKYMWDNLGKPLLFGSAAAVGLSILVYLVR